MINGEGVITPWRIAEGIGGISHRAEGDKREHDTLRLKFFLRLANSRIRAATASPACARLARFLYQSIAKSPSIALTAVRYAIKAFMLEQAPSNFFKERWAASYDPARKVTYCSWFLGTIA